MGFNVKDFFIIKEGHTYSAPCPYCRQDRMKHVSQEGAFHRFKCKNCGQELLYGGKLGVTRSTDRQAGRVGSLGKNKDFSMFKKKIF